MLLIIKRLIVPLGYHYMIACVRLWLHEVISLPSDEILAQVDDSELSKFACFIVQVMC